MEEYMDNLMMSRNFAIIMVIASTVFAIICAIDAWRGKFKGNEKMFWIVLILLAPIFGAAIYLGFGKKNKIDK